MSNFQFEIIQQQQTQERELMSKFGIQSLDNAEIPESLATLLTSCLVWGIKNPTPLVKALKNSESFNIICGMTLGRKHLGHLSMMKELSGFCQMGGLAYLIFNNRKHSDGGIQQAKDTWNDLNLSWQCLKPQDLENVSLILDTNTSKFHILERIIAESLSVNKICQLYGWSLDEMTLSRIHEVTSMIATLLYSSYYMPETPSLCLVDKHQATHVEAAKITAKRMKLRLPTFTYRTLVPSLIGIHKRMSIKDQNSLIYLDDDYQSIRNKLSKAVTGGRPTKDEQIKLGGTPSICPVFRASITVQSPHKTEVMENTCKAGTKLCGECKNDALKTIQGITKPG